MERLVFQLASQSYLNSSSLASFKRKFAKKSGKMVRNSQILSIYRELVRTGRLKKSPFLEKALRLKKVRSLSGIVPVAVMTKPYPCPGDCLYCPTQRKMPKSYLANEPAVMRAQMADFDPYLQIKRRIKQLKMTGHSVDKIELIVMGGTFSSLPWAYQKSFLKACYEGANNKKSSSLALAQKENEKAKNRIIGLTLETRPDKIDQSEIKRMRLLGATRVEIGVQSIYDSVLKKVKRGHGVKEVVLATQLLKEAGFKICYHLMPNLPGSDLKKDYLMFKKIFNDQRFKPDMLKIYPCVVVAEAELYQWFKDGKYEPYKEGDLIKLLIRIKKIVPEWVRINRLGRDIPASYIKAGSKLSNIRQVLHKKKVKCDCIRCREIRGQEKGELKLKIRKYLASKGKEYFLQYVDENNQVAALLRLRISGLKKHFLPVLEGAGIIREVHTYGLALGVGKRGKKDVQHEGLGKRLIKKAEEIVKKEGLKKVAVISGIGAREYYQKLGYKLEGGYMVKRIG